MVNATRNNGDASTDINIQHYILEEYVPAKAAEPTLQLRYLDSTEIHQPTADVGHAQLRCPQLVFPFARSDSTAAEVPIKAAQELVAANEETAVKRVLELTLETHLTNGTSYYQPGDTIAIIPRNDTQEVEALLAALQLEHNAHSACQLQLAPNCTKKSAKLPAHMPPVTTPYELLCDCLNLHAVPKKQFLSALANCCGCAEERAFLSCLSAKEASGYYNALILERGLTLLELLQLCPSCRPTLELLIEHLPRLQPRPYSIANSPHTHANQIKIIFSILTAKPGVTTRMLTQIVTPILEQADKNSVPRTIVMYFRETNKFRFTADAAVGSNQILIGVGTALAPFLGFLDYKRHLADSVDKLGALGQTWLFAGAATEACLPHRERVLQLHKVGALQQYFECFSRVPEARYRYVQEPLKAQAKALVEFLLQDSTVLYVCADGRQISKSIEKAVCECLMVELQLPESEAMQMLKAYRTSGKYREDLWA